MNEQIFTVIKSDWTVLYSGTSYEAAYDCWINENGFQILYQDKEGGQFHTIQDIHPYSMVLTPEEILTFATELYESVISGNLSKDSLPNYIDHYLFSADEQISSANLENFE